MALISNYILHPKCLRHARHDFEVYGMRLETRLIRRCYLNMARICVDVPEMACGRAREIVTLEDLQMAKLYLDAVKMPGIVFSLVYILGTQVGQEIVFNDFNMLSLKFRLSVWRHIRFNIS